MGPSSAPGSSLLGVQESNPQQPMLVRLRVAGVGPWKATMNQGGQHQARRSSDLEENEQDTRLLCLVGFVEFPAPTRADLAPHNKQRPVSQANRMLSLVAGLIWL